MLQMVKKDIIFLSHTRLFDPNEPEKEYSVVWEPVKDGVTTEVDIHSTLFNRCIVFATKIKYHDMPTFLLLLREAVRLQPAVIITPFTPVSGEYEDEMIEILKQFKGIIIAVTAGPSEKAQKELPNLRGYVGPDEGEMGALAAEIIATHSPKHVLIPNDKPFHEGYRERIQRIKEVAAIHGVESVREVFFEVDKEETYDIEPEEDTVIIGLGPKGAKVALKVREKYPDRIVGISTMDMSDEIKKAIESKILYAVIQHPREQGVKAVQMAVDILEGKASESFRKILCKARIISALMLIAIQNTILKHIAMQCVSSFITIIS